MKIISASGNLLSVGVQPFRKKSGKFDHWCTHGNVVGAPTIQGGASGNFYLFCEFVLKDGSDYFYTSAFSGTEDQMESMIDNLLFAAGPAGFNGFTGEFFNFWLRSRLTDKTAGSDFGNWYAAH